ncbi:MAG: hypothetical protein ISQ76_01475 [Opitutales bacterium]|nr:hypothetical protein [Opitutales bacterium]
MAIHWPLITEPKSSFAFSKARWIAASLAPLLPRNDKHDAPYHSLVFARAKPVAIDWPSLPGQRNPPAFPPRRDGLPRRPFCPTRNDKMRTPTLHSLHRKNTTLAVRAYLLTDGQHSSILQKCIRAYRSGRSAVW